MFKLLFSFLLLSSVASGEVSSDKLKHVAVSYAIQTLNYEFWKTITNNDKTGSLVMSTATTLLLGVVKEMHDVAKPQGQFSVDDMLANGLGVGLSVSLTIAFDL